MFSNVLLDGNRCADPAVYELLSDRVDKWRGNERRAKLSLIDVQYKSDKCGVRLPAMTCALESRHPSPGLRRTIEQPVYYI